ncbi:MAG: SDR family NAD(P)-dependent oxidoreductase [Leptonema sp. (in: bacteria)]
MKVILLTGATDGIGKALINPLLELGYKVLIHGRSSEKVDALVSEYQKKSNSNIEGYVADLGNFKEVQQMCEMILENQNQIDVILHNAGTYEKKLILNADDIEKTFAVNFVSNLLIDEKLFPLLNKNLNQRKEKDEYIKIIFVSSIAHKSGIYNFSEWIRPKVYNGYYAYANSKMAQIMYGYYLSREWGKYNILVNSLHPGVINTKILKENFGVEGASVLSGIQTPLYLVTTEEKHTGKYFNNQREDQSSPETYNQDFQKELYTKTKELIEKYI